jgi:hypothetical protein
MAKEAFPLDGSGLVDLERPPELIVHPERMHLDTNEYGIVIPPPMLDCMRENCRFRGDNETCRLTQHHLHSSKPFHEAHGGLAAKFRELIHLTVWIYACRHNDHHDRHIIDVTVPFPEAMKQTITETRKLRRLDENYLAARGSEKIAVRPNQTEAEIAGLRRARDRFMQANEGLIEGVDDITVLPEELITGALLMMAPEYARARIMQGSGYVLTGNIPREEAAAALAFAQGLSLEKAAA